MCAKKHIRVMLNLDDGQAGKSWSAPLVEVSALLPCCRRCEMKRAKRAEVRAQINARGSRTEAPPDTIALPFCIDQSCREMSEKNLAEQNCAPRKKLVPRSWRQVHALERVWSNWGFVTLFVFVEPVREAHRVFAPLLSAG